ncbi:MAG: DUF5591 domain-containing protein [Conexivisphaerales archaeon]|nr:DUF5591 domain-containing protein [Conexivisphaerales archaeon]
MGEVRKFDGVDPFKHPAVVAWHRYLFERWRSSARVALLLPCTAKKPYGNSPTHKIAYAIAGPRVQVYSVSEPMLLVPRELEECYPFDGYDYPPELMTKEEREEFIGLLARALSSVSRYHGYMVAVLPSHHRRILEEASRRASVQVEIHPYGRLAFRSVKEAALRAEELARG